MTTERTRVQTARGRRLETCAFDEQTTEVDTFAPVRALASVLVERDDLADLPTTYEQGAPRTFMM